MFPASYPKYLVVSVLTIVGLVVPYAPLSGGRPPKQDGPPVEQGRLQFRSEFSNLFNTPNFGQPGGISFTTTSSITPDGPRDGEIRSLRNPMRVIQFAAKIYF